MLFLQVLVTYMWLLHLNSNAYYDLEVKSRPFFHNKIHCIHSLKNHLMNIANDGSELFLHTL